MEKWKIETFCKKTTFWEKNGIVKEFNFSKQ